MVVINNYEEFEQYIGKELGVSEYLKITQEQINLFADATLDHQWIHVDEERARTESQFGTTIAHGYLTLSVLPHMWAQIADVRNVKSLINYGIEKQEDQVYIVGDFSFGETEQVRRLLDLLQGTKYLVVGNKDESSLTLTKSFKWIREIVDLNFRVSAYPFLQEDFRLVLCHYPILSWNGKREGVCMVHGYCHGRLDEYNRLSGELRVDVGINARLSRTNGGFISLEELYNYFRWVSGNELFEKYIKDNQEKFLI